jgi:plastocyanin
MPRSSSPRWGSSRAALVALAVTLGPVLGGTGPAPVAAARPLVTHTVVMEAVSFQPAALTTRAGDVVVWVNRDPFPHTATAASFDSKVIPAGGSWKHTTKAPGEFAYVCALHPTMKATLRVR